MAEAFAWPEGAIYLWTGTATASALVGYCQSVQGALARGWDNRPRMDGSYVDHLTGQRADVLIGAAYQRDSTLAAVFDSATAVHLKLLHSSVNGTAGYTLWSGRLDNLTLVGNERTPYVYSLAYHANKWSAF